MRSGERSGSQREQQPFCSHALSLTCRPRAGAVWQRATATRSSPNPSSASPAPGPGVHHQPQTQGPGSRTASAPRVRGQEQTQPPAHPHGLQLVRWLRDVFSSPWPPCGLDAPTPDQTQSPITNPVTEPDPYVCSPRGFCLPDCA